MYVLDLESHLTIAHRGEPLVEIWPAKTFGRYLHKRDQHPEPIDPNFTGVGRCITGSNGSCSFTTIKRGTYAWKNHLNAWLPAHIYSSLSGQANAALGSRRRWP